MEYLVLGPLVVADDGQPVPVGGPRQRLVLALLVDRANHVIQVDDLIDELWGDQPPGHPRKTVQVYVSNLRRVMGPGTIESAPSGYRLRVDPAHVDLLEHATLLERARSAPPEAAVAHYRQAETLWRGEPFADLPHCDRLAATAVRLQELHVDALEARIDLELRLGGAHDAVAELEGLVRRYPLRERGWASLMHALYLTGRQSDALAAYQRARDRLIEEIGVEPGAALADMERRILAHDPSLGDRPAHAAAVPDGEQATGPEIRAPAPSAPAVPAHATSGHRTVTALCCAATGTDGLADTWDPRDAVDLLDRFRRAVTRVLADHGGFVVTSATPVVVAYFGLATTEGRAPVDAAVAALAVVATIAALRLDGLPAPPRAWGAQIGIDSGLAVLDEHRGGAVRTPLVGAVVAAADRLRSVAQPGQVLVTVRTAGAIGGLLALGTPADRRALGGDGEVTGVPVLGRAAHPRSS